MVNEKQNYGVKKTTINVYGGLTTFGPHLKECSSLFGIKKPRDKSRGLGHNWMQIQKP
jgi:hypothetical protein